MHLDVATKQSMRQTKQQVRKTPTVPVPVPERVFLPKPIDKTNVSSSEICAW